jgi:hypothetical protein
VLAASLTAPLAASCSDILGVSGYRAGAKDAGTDARKPDASGGAIRYWSTTCASCMAAHCEAEQTECARDAACSDYANCYFGCDPNKADTCLYDCAQRLKARNEAAARLVACEFRGCPQTCFSCGLLFSAYAPNCASCALQDTAPNGLCDLIDRCVLDPGCNDFITCNIEQCKKLGTTDPECRLTCGMRYPSAARDVFQTVGNRYFFGCQAKCSAGANWDCTLGVWPPMSGKTAVVTLQLPASTPDGSVSPVHVRACKGADYGCATAIEGDADATGKVTFTVDQIQNEGSYYYEIYAPIPGYAAPYWIYSPWQPVVGDITLWVSAGPASVGLGTAAATRGEVLDGVKKGTVDAFVADCVGGFADFRSLSPEVTMTASSGGRPYYGTDVLATGGGDASFINVPPGSASIVVQRLGATIATAVVPIRAGAFTFVVFNYFQAF